ncbi:putative bifunctional diguanylate cyclase/phosphodiesterase [Catellatospora tritici]|uniref:putative bifunctional diguanylate cyclase/phosphodiesterase n=1 Tax=Catellatospora tritici TaxID=2851566 RepID=UPI001C2D6E22|nr:EAL domain-containing protein [Catellatospora tritici]MBV1853663.1 EAL domain-containing protein [Catellatospora tritici]
MGFFALPSPADDVVWAMIGAGSAAAIAYGVIRNRPVPSRPWWLLCAAVALLFLGDTDYDLVTDTRHLSELFPSPADVFYLAMYPVLAAGLLGLAGPRRRRGRAAIPLDTMILVSGLGLLMWIFLITPHLADSSLSTTQRLLSVAYPVGDVLILATIGRLIVVRRFTPAVLLMTVGAAGLLVTDLVYALSHLRGHGPVGGPVDIGWLLFYGGWAAAALHPSMVELSRPLPVPRQLSTARQVSLLAAALLPSGLLVYEAARGGVLHTPAIAVCASVTTVLVAARFYTLIGDRRSYAARVDIVRTTSAGLVAAHDLHSVRDTLATAVHRLAEGGPHTFRMIMGPRGRPGLDGIAATCDLVEAATLPPLAAAAVAPFSHALACPIRPDRDGDGDAEEGVVLVGGDPELLQLLQAPVETVAAQAALALDRIVLARQITQRDSEQYFRALVQNATDVILIVDADDLRVRYASPSAPSMFGPGELLGADLVEQTDADGRPDVREQLKTAPGGPTGSVADWTLLRRDGQRVEAEVICRDLRGEPAIAGIVVTLRDVTVQRRLQREMTYHAYHDSLTRLMNRTAFRRRLSEASARAERVGSLAGVLYLDLDDFKLVNDTLGHESGDRLLRLVAERILHSLRPYDTAARLGGDEFAVLVEDAPSPQTVYTVADRVVAALARPFDLDGRLVSGRASVGVAFTTDGHNAADLLRQADVALYAAKAQGKGRWLRHDPSLDTQTVERMQLRAELEQALPNGEFLLEYQPIVRLADRTTVGFEALLRWDHPVRGRLMPGQFIEIAEETGAIVAIGNWALSEAAAAAATWPASPDGTAPYVSVNVSARQFRTAGFAEHVLHTLEVSGLPARRLLLEITETLLLRDDEQVWHDLASLRQAGVRVAIDDFGTGYSALNYLRHTPLDVLKLDRVFTSSITTSAHQADLVAGIVDLARRMDLDAVAEGVEQQAELDHLLRAGCAYGQGYLFARPMSSEDARAWTSASDHR